MSHVLVCLLGESGSGKDTLARLAFDEGEILKSYTTRERRYPDEDTHTFITKEEYDALPDKVATTFFDGNYYCATKEQVENSCVYILDPDGYKELQEKYKGDTKLMPFYIRVSPFRRFVRMVKRGDSPVAALRRLIHDQKKFKEFRQAVDPYRIIDNNSKKTGKALYRIWVTAAWGRYLDLD